LEGAFLQKALQNLTKFSILDLSYCSLNSVLLTYFNWRMMLSNIEYLNLEHNSFRGAILAQIGQLTNLRELILDHNQLDGSIPPELGALSNLNTLVLSHNNLQGNFLDSIFHSLTYVNTFHLSANNLSGKIESFDLSKMPTLLAFILYGNAFHGGLPTGLTEHQELLVLDSQGIHISQDLWAI
jgi:uncharacterized protein YjbI with pentapeptide repeats